MKWMDTVDRILIYLHWKDPTRLQLAREKLEQKESELLVKMANRGLLDGYQELDDRYKKVEREAQRKT